jgi:hypothetical protein
MSTWVHAAGWSSHHSQTGEQDRAAFPLQRLLSVASPYSAFYLLPADSPGAALTNYNACLTCSPPEPFPSGDNLATVMTRSSVENSWCCLCNAGVIAHSSVPFT